jgi:hypothetical protein
MVGILLAGGLVPTLRSAPAHSPQDKQIFETWKKDIKPMLENYCYDCHGDGQHKGKLDMDQFSDLAKMRENPRIWEHIQAQIDYHLMPPPDEEQPKREERDKLIRWINDAVFPVDPNKPDPGHVVIRRMNRIEYKNTIRDLLGVKIDTSKILPPDDSGFGFDNIGSVLTTSSSHIEKYLHTAELALGKALVIGPMKKPTISFDSRKLKGDGKRSEEGVYLSRSGTVRIDPVIDHPDRAGEYSLHISASAHQAGDEPAFIDIQSNGKHIHRFKVANEFGEQKTFSTTIKLDNGRNKLTASFTNDFYDPKAVNPRRRDRNLMIHKISVQGPSHLTVEKPETHRRIFIARKKGLSDQDYARQVLAKFARLAFRRPISKNEISRYLGLVTHIAKNDNSVERGIQGALQAMLVSPSFLFINGQNYESDTGKVSKISASQISEHALASRLSYFLWSSMPDGTLLDLADRGELRTNLDHQVLRMLKDDRAKQMIRHFSGQWLQIRDLAIITPDRKIFPTFTDALRKDMKMETEMLVNHIFRGNSAGGNLMDFLNADYSFINERLAKHYMMTGVKGYQFREVSLTNTQRRGILTHASLLTITSQATRTSAVLRGKFVLENILDITPPPPPPNLPALEEQEDHDKHFTLREQLTRHRQKPACAGCHNLMDPVGLAFEHFDAIGRFREFDNGQPIDASGKLVTGELLENAESLRQIISSKKRDDFIRCLTVKMMTYALGRGVTRYDRLTIEKIIGDIKQNDYNSQALILGIIHSHPFQNQRAH